MLKLDSATLEAIRDHAAAGYPGEICGLLVGEGAPDDHQRRVDHAVRIDNVHAGEAARDRYELDPAQHLRAQRQARGQGLRLIGVYHSHPDHPPVPSKTDHARALDIWQDGPSWSYLIVRVGADGAGQARSWVLRDGSFAEEDLLVPRED